MKQRALGRSGLEVSAMGLGCMGLSFVYESAIEPQGARYPAQLQARVGK